MATSTPAPSTAAAPSAAVQALNASREAAYNAKTDVTAGANKNLSTFQAANPTLNTAGGSGTVPVQVPTKAPAVFSATAATNKVNNVYIPTMNNATTAVANHNATLASSFDPTYNFQPGETAAAYNARIKAYQQTNKTQTTDTTQPATTTPADQAAKDLANTPDAGHQFVWDANGNRIPIPVGTKPPEGYSTTQPPTNPVTSNTPMVDHFVDTQGNTFAQYNNGTYGQIDSNGNFVGTITPQDFNNAKQNSPQAQLDTLHATTAQIQTSLSMIANGSYPLNPTQQAIISGLQTQLAADVATQTQANADLTGGTTVAMNLYGMGTSLAGIGKIKATVDSGVQKILDLQTKAATAVAQMSDSFMKDDMAMLKTAYDMYDSSAKDIQTNITNIQNGIRQAKVDAQNEAHQNFQDMMTADNYTLTAKKNAFDQYIQQADLDEKKKVDATDAWYKSQDLALRRQAQNPYNPNSNGATPVALSSTGKPSAAGQASFLAQFPANVQTQIQGLASYKLLPTSFPTRAAKGQMDRATAVALAKQFDPTYDENLAATRQKVATTYNDGTSAPSKNITALNTAAGHLATLAADSSKLGNIGFEPANFIKNTVGGALGITGNAGAKLDIGAVTGELASAFKQSGATDQEIKSLGTINANSSPAQVKSYIESATALMGSKLGALQDSYTSAMGTPPPNNFLHTSAAADLIKLQGQGYDIQVPQLDQTAPVQLKNFVSSNPANSAVYDQAKNAIMQINGGQPPSADDIYQLLQTKGYLQ